MLGLTELVEAMRQCQGVLSVELEGESPVTLRAEFLTQEHREAWILKLALAGFGRTQPLVGGIGLIVIDE